MKHLPWLFIIFLISLEVHDSYGAAQSDSTNIKENALNFQLRRFDQDIIDEFKGDADFMYNQPPNTRPNFLQIIFRKIFEWLVYIFGNAALAWLVLIILILLGIVGLGFAFYGIFGVGKTIPIYSKEVDSLKYSVKEENIHEMNFSDEIDIAVEQKDYKRAIRLVYLFALKIMSDQRIIEWLPSKTNHDYLYEIRNAEFQRQFSTLSYFFEYVWYGDFQPDIAHYKEMRETFAGLKKNLGSNGQA